MFTRAGVAVGQPPVTFIRNATSGQEKHWIVATPAVRTAIPGTRILYSVGMGPELRSPDSTYTYQWLCLNDADTSKSRNVREVALGSRTAFWNATWDFPGNHRILCRLLFHPTGSDSSGDKTPEIPEYIEYQQAVSSSGDLLTAAMARAAAPLPPDEQLRMVRGYRDALLAAEQQPGSAKLDPNVKERLELQVTKLEDKLKSSEGKVRIPVLAVHVATESARVSELNVFVARLSAQAGLETWTLVDITNPADRRLTSEHTGTGEDAKTGILNAIRAWEDNRYPKGQIRVKIPVEAGAEIEREFHTEGATFWDSDRRLLQPGGVLGRARPAWFGSRR